MVIQDPQAPVSGPVIYTIGHSTRTLEAFTGLLKIYGIRLVADIRSLPGSRRVPHFNAENLEPALAVSAIRYVLLKKLGGLRPATKSVANAGWRNKSFRGFADYMQTDAFHEGLAALISLSERQSTVMMCAEALPWRCHRSLIGDALLVRGVRVMDIFSGKKQEPHRLTSFAKVEGTNLTYPALEG